MSESLVETLKLSDDKLVSVESEFALGSVVVEPAAVAELALVNWSGMLITSKAGQEGIVLIFCCGPLTCVPAWSTCTLRHVILEPIMVVGNRFRTSVDERPLLSAWAPVL